MKVIFKALLGSRGYGVEDETSDYDYTGVAIEPSEAIIGLGNFDEVITKNPDENSQTTIYGLRKYLRLALKGNPTIAELLWAPTLVTENPYTQGLIELRKPLLSKRTLKSYYHYMDDQIKRLKGERGQKSVNRAELVAKHGYDTKYAYHIVRLGLMGQVLGQTGRLYMPLDSIHRTMLKEIRHGEWLIEKVYETAETGKVGIEHYIKHSDLPDTPDEKAVEEWLMSVYRREYGLVHF